MPNHSRKTNTRQNAGGNVKVIKCSRAAKFQLLTSKDGTGMALFSKDAQWPTFGTIPGILLADSVPKFGTD